MIMQTHQRQLPERNTLSVLVGIILLSYSLTHFVSIPSRRLEFTLAGIYLPLTINYTTLVTLLVAGLAASGSAWLLSFHPASRHKNTAGHWILPGLTSLVLMTAIEQLPFGPVWWAAALGSGVLLSLILISEYIALDPNNRYYLGAEIGITALSLVLFLILSIALHAGEIRLFFRVPVLSFSAGLVFLRVLHIRKKDSWSVPQAVVVFFLIGELSAALHYWPLNSLSFGLALLGPLYGSIELTDNLKTSAGKVKINQLIGPFLIVILSWILALWV